MRQSDWRLNPLGRLLYMKNALFFEKRRCSRMSLQRQMFTPFMKNALFFEKRRCSRISLQRQRRIHSSLRRGGAAGYLCRDKRSPVIWRTRSSLRRGGVAGCLCKGKLSPLLWRIRSSLRGGGVATKPNVHPFFEEYTLLWEEEV